MKDNIKMEYERMKKSYNFNPNRFKSKKKKTKVKMIWNNQQNEKNNPETMILEYPVISSLFKT